jgi:IclR family transcriptional regulator, pca regulon regulatory protein
MRYLSRLKGYDMAEQGRDAILEREDGLFVASLAKGMSVLECFRGRRNGLSLLEITKIAGIGKSATQRAVVTLHRIGYLVRDERTKTYKLSPKILAICGDYLSSSELVDLALPLLRELGDKFSETVNLSQRLGDQLVVVGRHSSRQALSVTVSIGTRYPLVSTAPGLVMLAFSDWEDSVALIRRATLEAWTPSTIVDPIKLIEWMTRVRSSGYAVGYELMHEGEISVAAPIFAGVESPIIGAINISVPTSRWTSKKVEKTLVPAAIETAAKISHGLGTSDGATVYGVNL